MASEMSPMGVKGLLVTSWEVITKMADDEDGGVERAKERCSLLKALKRTVNRLIVMDTENNWAILEVQERIIDDIVRILRHGQRGKQVS